MGVTAEDIIIARTILTIAPVIAFFVFNCADPTSHLEIPHSSITGSHPERERVFRGSMDHKAFRKKWRWRLFFANLVYSFSLAVVCMIIPVNDVGRFVHVSVIVGILDSFIFRAITRNMKPEYEKLAMKHGLSKWQ